MRELVFSVGLTFLTGTLLFVYFRNKFNNIDNKVNMVFDTIQQHNKRMEEEAQMEAQRFAEYQHRQMQEMQNRMNEDPLPSAENMEQNNAPGLIDVSDNEDTLENKELDTFDSDDSEEDDSDDEDSDDSVDSDDDNDHNDTHEKMDLNNLEKLVQPFTVENLEKLNSENEANDPPLDLQEVEIEPANIDYAKLTKNKLKSLCEEKNLTGYKSLNKKGLVQLLQAN